ncbi:MAG: RsmB/NOP family class I SAM-dependent RNA methyltransferase [Candidatus Woesearchaeota archaeon]
MSEKDSENKNSFEIKEMPWASEFKQKIKPEFEKRYKSILGDNYELFIRFSLSFQRESFRINTLKVSKERINEVLERIKKNFVLERIPWYEYGYFYSGQRRDIGNTLEHTLGYIYVQEAASMIPPIVLNPSEQDKVLDIAAAPGSKTTLLAEIMKNKGIIVANDPDYSRIKALSQNVQRIGATNVVITNQDGLSIRESFSKILLDAPCSGIGTIRKSPSTIEIYNVNMIKRLSKLQKKLIEHSFNILEREGVLVYSTCTLEPEENEAVINHLLKNHENAELERIRLNIKSSPPILNFEGEYFDDRIENCLRIWPQDNNTDGFFVAKIIKL